MRLPRRRGRERSTWERLRPRRGACCAVGTASTSCVPWIAMEEPERRWTRLLDRHQVAPESRVAVEATIRAEGDLTAVAGPLGPFHLVHVARFLKREILAELASLLAPGGLLLYHTFVEDPPRAQHAVAPGELRRAFASGLEVLRDDVEAIDDGRALSFFAARSACV